MNDPRSLDFQLCCLRDVMSAAKNPNIRAGLEQLEKTVEWIKRREHVFKMLEALRKDDPRLYDNLIGLTNTFPGIRLADIRRAPVDEDRELEAEEAGL